MHTNKSGINAFYNRLTYQKWAKISPRAIVLSKIMASLEQATHAVHREPLFILIIHIHKMIIGVCCCIVSARAIANGRGTCIIMNYNNWQRVKIHWKCLFLLLIRSLYCIPCAVFHRRFSHLTIFLNRKISVFIFVYQRCFNISLVKTHTKRIKIFHMNGYSFSLCKYLLLMNRQLNEPRKIEYFLRARAFRIHELPKINKGKQTWAHTKPTTRRKKK